MDKYQPIWVIFCFGFLIYSAIAFPAADEDGEQTQGDDASKPELPITIVSESMNISASADESVTLPCQILNKDQQASLIWRKNEAILFVDDRCVAGNVCAGYQVDSNGSLKIKRVGDSGGGRYSCGFRSARLTHEVGVEPSVELAHSKKSIEAGQNLELYCKASGYPEPKIVWVRQQTPDSPKITVGNSGNVTIQAVATDVHSGMYTCSAFNDRSQVASKSINVTVLNGVSAEYPVVNAGESAANQRLCCKFDKYKNIMWSKGQKDLSPESSHYKLESSKRQSCVSFRDVTEEDLGVYSCRVKTESGAPIVAEIRLTGTPAIPALLSTKLDEHRNPVLEWSVKSALSPVTRCVLSVKKAEETDKDWKMLIEIPAVDNSTEQTFKYTFMGLRNGVYDVELEAFNKFGSSKLRSPSAVVIDVPVVIAEKIGTGAASHLKISVMVLLILPITFIWL